MALVPTVYKTNSRFLFSHVINQMAKRFASNCKKSVDACCGARQDCHLKPCKNEQKECCYASCVRPQCRPFKLHLPCDWNPCGLYPLFDWLYYQQSDKAKRKYQKTWKDCPPVMKTKCCYKDIPEFPPLKRRSKTKVEEGCRPPTACEANPQKFDAICKPKKEGGIKKCPYIDAPCCPKGRIPPRCYQPRGPLDCLKTCCPYPSFSECCIGGIAKIPGRAIQCKCLGPVSWCETTRVMSKKEWPPKN